MTRDEIAAGVRTCLATALDVPADDVREEARLVDDLGADSLDLLDILFQLEQAFHVTVAPRDFERRARERLGGEALAVDGVYTPRAVDALRDALPEVPAAELREGLTTAELPRTFRVATLVNLVARLLEERNAAGLPAGKEAV
jgi:acyl carrier protein